MAGNAHYLNTKSAVVRLWSITICFICVCGMDSSASDDSNQDVMRYVNSISQEARSLVSPLVDQEDEWELGCEGEDAMLTRVFRRALSRDSFISYYPIEFSSIRAVPYTSPQPSFFEERENMLRDLVTELRACGKLIHVNNLQNYTLKDVESTFHELLSCFDEAFSRSFRDIFARFLDGKSMSVRYGAVLWMLSSADLLMKSYKDTMKDLLDDDDRCQNMFVHQMDNTTASGCDNDWSERFRVLDTKVSDLLRRTICWIFGVDEDRESVVHSLMCAFGHTPSVATNTESLSRCSADLFFAFDDMSIFIPLWKEYRPEIPFEFTDSSVSEKVTEHSRRSFVEYYRKHGMKGTERAYFTVKIAEDTFCNLSRTKQLQWFAIAFGLKRFLNLDLVFQVSLDDFRGENCLRTLFDIGVPTYKYEPETDIEVVGRHRLYSLCMKTVGSNQSFRLSGKAVVFLRNMLAVLPPQRYFLKIHDISEDVEESALRALYNENWTRCTYMITHYILDFTDLWSGDLVEAITDRLDRFRQVAEYVSSCEFRYCQRHAVYGSSKASDFAEKQLQDLVKGLFEMFFVLKSCEVVPRPMFVHMDRVLRIEIEEQRAIDFYGLLSEATKAVFEICTVLRHKRRKSGGFLYSLASLGRELSLSGGEISMRERSIVVEFNKWSPRLSEFHYELVRLTKEHVSDLLDLECDWLRFTKVEKAGILAELFAEDNKDRQLIRPILESIDVKLHIDIQTRIKGSDRELPTTPTQMEVEEPYCHPVAVEKQWLPFFSSYYGFMERHPEAEGKLAISYNGMEITSKTPVTLHFPIVRKLLTH